MRLHVVALREGFVAGRALVRSLSVVGPHVDGQVLSARTRLPANAADKRPEARVDPQVVVQVRPAFEIEQPYGVSPVWIRVVAFGREALAADAAPKRPRLAVGPHVTRQVAVGVEGFAANLTEEEFLSRRVNLLVFPQT